MATAVTIIKDEHRAMASILRGLLYLVEQTRSAQRAPDFTLLRAMVNYIESFPDKLHHPKEDEYVYRVLRERDPSVAPALDEIQDEHRRGPDATRKLSDALESYQRDPATFEAFAGLVKNYADFQFAHMRKEEEGILPVAERALLPSDWTAIDAAFGSNADPLVGIGTQQEFRELFKSVVNLMPAPMGLGPERR